MIKIIISTVFGIINSIIFFLFGDLDFLIKSLLAVMILDYLTGICKAYIQKSINSKIGIKGILKKFLYLVIVSLSVILGQILGTNLILRNLVIYSIIFNEMISIIENCGQIGIKLPKKLLDSIKDLNIFDYNNDKL